LGSGDLGLSPVEFEAQYRVEATVEFAAERRQLDFALT
jgi:hypothetical protein